MTGAVAFLWIVIVILGLAWVLLQTGAMNLGVDFGLWIHVLLGLAVVGAVFNLFVMPFLERRRTSETSSSSTTRGPANATAHRETVRETRDRTSA
jgi:hypothetical protein